MSIEKKRYARLAPALVLAFAVAACDDISVNPTDDGVPEGELSFVTFPVDLATQIETTGQVWAVKGEHTELELEYVAGSSGPGSDEFLEFDIPGDALLRRPDGSLFQDGDSVLITVTVSGDRKLLFEFEPSGLVFDPAEPALLRVEYRRLQGDVDGDGTVTDDDAELESEAAIWKRERPGDPFTRLGTVKDLDADELRAEITGFTGFAIAARTSRLN